MNCPRRLRQILCLVPLALSVLACGLLAHSIAAQQPPADLPAAPEADGARIVFLGDSITYDGRYVQYLETYLLTRNPATKMEILNLALPSEGVTGLSEPAHPFPRPNVHERLGRVLKTLRPPLVIACYGMNDGMYYPFSADRFAQYQQGINQLIDAVRAAEGQIGLITSPPFDALPVADKLRGEDAEEYAWFAPYRDYDAVMQRYSEWLLTLRGDARVLRVVDARTPTLEYLQQQRKTNPRFAMANDGVHTDAVGHWLLAEAIIRMLSNDTRTDRLTISLARQAAIDGKVQKLNVMGNGTLLIDWPTRLPMPRDPQWPAKTVDLSKFNSHMLTVQDPKHDRYALMEGGLRLAIVTRQQLQDGLDLTQYPELSSNQQAARLLATVRQLQTLNGRAWLTAIGHKRPNTEAGEPLADALPRSQRLRAEARELAAPVTLQLRLEPVGN